MNTAPRHAWMVLLLLAACAAPATHWEKPGATAAAVQADNDQCLTDARLNAPQPAMFEQTGTVTTVLTVEEQRRRNEVEYFQKCMQAKGYSAKR